MDHLTKTLDLFRQGFGLVDAGEAVLISLVVAFAMRAYRHLVGWAAIATLLHEIANIGWRVLAGAANPLPDLGGGDLKLIGIRFAGYLIVISLFYLIRRRVLRR